MVNIGTHDQEVQPLNLNTAIKYSLNKVAQERQC